MSIDDATPVTVRLRENLRQRIRTGMWQPGKPLTPERRLAQQLGVCRATLRRTLTDLRAEGLLESRPPRGWFVADPESRRRTHTIGLLLDDIAIVTAPRPRRTLTGVYDVLADTSYHLNIIARNPGTEDGDGQQSPAGRPSSLASVVDPARLDGLMIASAEMSTQSVRDIARRLPTVRIDAHTVPREVPGVMQDFVGDTFKAARHLVELGHRRLLLLTVGDHSVQGQGQHDGARLCAQLRDDVRLDVIRSVRNATTEWLDDFRDMMGASRAVRPTALLCGSDELARNALPLLRELSLCVPKDVSVVSWNDSLPESEAGLAMTTVRPNHEEEGRIAGRTLVRMIDHLLQPVPELGTTIVPGRLLIRQSTASPADDA